MVMVSVALFYFSCSSHYFEYLLFIMHFLDRLLLLLLVMVL